MKKGLGIVGLVIIVFATLVISIVVLDKGCSKLDIGFAPFSGKFEHCAFAAGQATESAVLETGVSEDIARAASRAATDSAAESLKEGKSPEEAASAAAAAAFEAADGEGANRKEAIRAAATAGAAAAAAASSTPEDAEIATKAAAYAVATGRPENAKQMARELGASESVASNAASGAAEGIKAVRQLKDHPPINSPEPLTNETPMPRENVTGQNKAPVANSGDGQTVSANTEVTLDGSKSSDEDGRLVSYKWKQTDGPKVDIKDSDEAKASFNAPSLSEDSKLVFKLTVTDDQDASGSDQVSIKVKSNTESQPTEDKSNTESQPSQDKNNTESKSN
jgi:K319L-like, PKD domain